MTIAEKIKEFRDLKGLNQVELAKRCNINVGTIRKYETGERNPKIDQIIQIAHGLEVSPFIFYDFDAFTHNDVLILLSMIDDVEKIKTIQIDDGTTYFQFCDPKMQLALTQIFELKEAVNKVSTLKDKLIRL